MPSLAQMHLLSASGWAGVQLLRELAGEAVARSAGFEAMVLWGHISRRVSTIVHAKEQVSIEERKGQFLMLGGSLWTELVVLQHGEPAVSRLSECQRAFSPEGGSPWLLVCGGV